MMQIPWNIHVSSAIAPTNPSGILERLDGAKPLSEPMLEYCLFEPQEQISVKF